MDSRMDRWILSLLRALQNFETAVRENVTINGQPWEEAADDSRLQSGRRRFHSLPAPWVWLALVLSRGRRGPIERGASDLMYGSKNSFLG